MLALGLLVVAPLGVGTHGSIANVLESADTLVLWILTKGHAPSVP